MGGLLQDFRNAARSLIRSRGHTALVVGTLAVGIAASTGVFSVMNPYLLRPLPFADPATLIQIEQVDPQRGSRTVRFSLPQWRDWREGSRALDDVAAYRYDGASLTGGGAAERLMVSWTTPNIFSVLGVGALHGRTFGEGEGGPGAAPVVVLSHGLWTGRYGGDPRVVGRAIRLDGVEHTVLGVMPPGFTFPWNAVKAWIPERSRAAWSERDRLAFTLVGRLATGTTAQTAEEDLIRVQRELGAAHPAADGRYTGVNIRHLREALNFGYEAVRAGFLILLGAVGVLLLIACVNVAGLILARASRRERELAVRRALGAAPARVARQLLAESVVVALAAGAAGLALAWLFVSAVGPRLPEGLFRVGTASLDVRVILFALALTAATPLVFGLSPALRAARTAPADVLRSGTGGGDRSGVRRRKVLVVLQVGLAVVLAATTSLLGRSFLAVQRVDTGFAPGRIMAVEASPPATDYPTDEAVNAFFDRAADALAGVPGVAKVAQADRLPLNHETVVVSYATAVVDAAPDDWPTAVYARVGAGYFEATGTPIVEGRGFLPTDGAEAGPVVVISRSLAARAWPGESALGRTVRLLAGGTVMEAAVVGVAGDVRWVDLTTEPGPLIYRPLPQSPARRRFLVASVPGGVVGPDALVQPAGRSLARAAPAVPVTIRPMSRILRENDFQWAVSSVAVGVFGLLALLLAALGVFGLIAYSVTLRRRELAVRCALGAEAGALRRMVLGQGLTLAGAGLLAGIGCSLLIGRLIESILYGVRPADPVTFVSVAALFFAVAAAASAGPALRAARVQPAEVLRQE